MDEYLKRLKTLIELLKKENLSEIFLEDGSFKASIKRTSGEVLVESDSRQNKQIASELPLLSDNFREITSPLVGVVRLIRSDGTAYLTEGGVLKQGQAVCMIEAMKVLNEITATVSGRVKKILVKDKQLVEYGQTLVLVEDDV